jgi:hypothetical protein
LLVRRREKVDKLDPAVLEKGDFKVSREVSSENEGLEECGN